MNTTNLKIIENVVVEVLQNTPHRPFLCLPLSALLYAHLNDKHSLGAKLATGHLRYNGNFIFKQDFSIRDAADGKFREWAGHSWVEVDGLICDLSFFRTLYSENFDRPDKSALIEYFGLGRGCIIAPASNVSLLKYELIDILEDELATGIIQGFQPLLAF